MKISISYPPLNRSGCPMLGQNRQFQWFSSPSFIYPMVPASAATLLKREHHEVIWDDAIAQKKSSHEYWQHLRAEKPDVVAIETKTPVIKDHWTIAKQIKEVLPETAVVLMGDHVTALPEETMRSSPCDFVITGGDYDFSLRSIVQYLQNGKRLLPGIWYRENGMVNNTGAFEPLQNNLDDLPWIDRNLTMWRLYGEKLYKRSPFTYTMAGRDCPYGKCTFCSWTTLYPKFRLRSPENLVDEVEYLVKEFKVREIFDDTGSFPSGGWLERFCENMIEKKLNRKVLFSCNFRFDYLTLERAKLMKKAGFRLMKLGLESANQDTLDRLNKGTRISDILEGCRAAREAGLEVHLTTMVGYPWETRSDAERTVRLAKNLMSGGWASMLQATILMPYPGTPLFRSAVENGWFIIDPTDYEKMDMTRPILRTPDMESGAVKKLCQDLYKSFLTPGYMAKQLVRIRHVDDIHYYLRGIKPVLGHLNDFTQTKEMTLRMEKVRNVHADCWPDDGKR